MLLCSLPTPMTFSPHAFASNGLLVQHHSQPLLHPPAHSASVTLPRRRSGRLLGRLPLRVRCLHTPDPNLELHSAAASGNVGLVHYALTHGQPVNSLLHGCLPLHAASSGGNVSVVRMLIERGADVNAPRLPRRYSETKKTSNMPAVGTAGAYCVVAVC